MDFATDRQLEELAQKATHLSSHSGEVAEGGIFVALRGVQNDGHQYVSQLLKKGILAAVVQEKGIEAPNVLQVPNTQEAHWKLARYFRDKFQGPVIGVGGSSGKTSTKELLYQVLSRKFKCVKTEKSQNGLLGIPKTLEKLRPGVELAVVEIGIDAPGEMIRNVSLVKPTHALLTSIGEEHLLLLKDLEGVFREERILIDETIKRGGKAYCPREDSFLSRLSEATQVPATPVEVDSQLQITEQDRHVLQNMSMVASVALELGLSIQDILSAFNEYQPPDGRGLKWQRGHCWIIRDHYNANPSSMEVALESALQYAKEKGLSLRLMLGDMRELGSGSVAYHREVVKKARALGAKNLLWVGSEFKQALDKVGEDEFFLNSSSDELSPEMIQSYLQPGVVLVKGSRGTAMEKIMDRIFGAMP